MELYGYIASVFMGLSLGLIGGGGSILTVPILVYLFRIDPVQATAYSLFIVGLTALFGGLTYIRRGEVDLKTGLLFAAPSFLGVYFSRAFLVPALPDPVFSAGTVTISKALLIMLVFAVLMVAASWSMIRAKARAEHMVSRSAFITTALIAGEGLIVGAITGFVGAGGGFLIIPALVMLVGLPMKKAVGTSLLIIAVKSLLGFTGDLKHSSTIDWQLLLGVAGIAIIGLFIGTLLAKRVPEKVLKKGFGYFVLVMGSFVLADQIHKMLG